jgi:hypothetical protein
MTRLEAISELQRHADAIKAMGATSLYLFGSTVRDEATPGSDLDLFIDYDPDSRFSLIDLVGIKLFLEEQLGVKPTSRRGGGSIPCFERRSSVPRCGCSDGRRRSHSG